MIRARTNTVGRELERLLREGVQSAKGDARLLEKYLDDRDESAFETLVERHGPMVLSLCRRYLRDPRDVEDAFQATFLILVRKGPGLRDKASLSSWLYGVAYRVALRARSDVLKRRTREGTPDDLTEAVAPTARQADDMLEILDAEMSRLSEKYRAPLVLCYLEGRTHDQAAAELGWPVGTVRSRMAKARSILAPRLTRRGLDVSACLAVLRPEFLGSSITSTIPPSLVRAVLGGGGMASIASTSSSWPASALAQGVLTAMLISQLKWVGVGTTAFGLLAASAGVGAWATQDAPAGPQTTEGAPSAAPQPAPMPQPPLAPQSAPTPMPRIEKVEADPNTRRTPNEPDVRDRLKEMERKIDRLTELLQRLEQRSAFPPINSANLSDAPPTTEVRHPKMQSYVIHGGVRQPIELRQERAMPVEPRAPLEVQTPPERPAAPPAVEEAAPPSSPQRPETTDAPGSPQVLPPDPSTAVEPLPPADPGQPPQQSTRRPVSPGSGVRRADAVRQSAPQDHDSGGVRVIQAQLLNLYESYKRKKRLHEKGVMSVEVYLEPVGEARILVARLQEMDDEVQEETSVAELKFREDEERLERFRKGLEQAKLIVKKAGEKPLGRSDSQEGREAWASYYNARHAIDHSDSENDAYTKDLAKSRRTLDSLSTKRDRIRRTLAWAESHFEDLKQNELP